MKSLYHCIEKQVWLRDWKHFCVLRADMIKSVTQKKRMTCVEAGKELVENDLYGQTGVENLLYADTQSHCVKKQVWLRDRKHFLHAQGRHDKKCHEKRERNEEQLGFGGWDCGRTVEQCPLPSWKKATEG